MKNILLVASEAVPFIKTGGLADVIGALPKYFDKSIYDVRVMIPKYTCIDQELTAGFSKLATCSVTLNWRHQHVSVYTMNVEGITYYLLENDEYFSGDTPYGELHVDAEKFAFFAKAALTVLPLIGFKPDVIHCNDWQTGFIPVFLKEQFKKHFYAKTGTIFTIHNMRFQGRWSLDAYKDITGLPNHCFTFDKLEHYGDANPFKGGISYCDYVTTVSKTYAKEIQTPSYGEGLEGLMEYRKNDLMGIVNGLDTNIYHPVKDPMLAVNFSLKTRREGKVANKLALQKEVGLFISPDSFLIGMVSRLTDQKGFDLVVEKIDALMKYPDIQIVLQGTGDAYYQNRLQECADKYPGRIVVKIQYSEGLARRIYASADAFLMPSMFEPCGLSQLIALRYGTVPMVRQTGGLKDTVKPWNVKKNTGNGFGFVEYQADDMLQMILDAYHLYKNDRDTWEKLADRGMKQDHSWKKSAAAYAKLYDTVIDKHHIEISSVSLS